MVKSAPDETGILIEEVVNFTKNLSFVDIPKDVIQHAKLVLLDTIGLLLAACHPKYSAGRILTEFVRNLGGVEESTIIGQGFKSSCVNAALYNGTLGYYCDIDAYHAGALMHAPATIVPACLAVGERQEVHGKDFLIAMILGIDFACRISLALNPRSLTERGFHPTSVAGSFASALASGRLLNLDSKELSIALGLAGNQTSGLRAWKQDFSENSRPFNAGIAARNGVTAALLAKLDFGGPHDIFEGIYDIFRAYSKADECDPGQLTHKLGTKFLIMEHAFKLYACCAYLHPGLDALLNLMRQHHLTIENIHKIVMHFPESGVEMIDGTQLRSHSAQYTFSVAALNGKVMIDDILYDLQSEPEIHRLVRNIEVVPNKTLDSNFPSQFSSIVEVTTTHGNEISTRVDFAKGTPQNPASHEEIEKKFIDLSGEVIQKEKQNQILGLVNDIDNVKDIGWLCSLLE